MNRPWNLFASGLVTNLLTGMLLVGILSASGCRDSSSPSNVAPATPGIPTGDTPVASPDPEAAPVPGVTKIPAGELAIGDYMPPLDEDRIEIAKPKGWLAFPRDSNFLTRFYQTNRNGLPRIEIKVEPKTYDDLATVTPENVEQFAKLVAVELGDLKLVEAVLPLQVGDTPCARYVGLVELKLPTGKKISAERQRLIVLQDGRQYTIDLLVLPNTLRKSRNAAYAVCASLRFGGGSLEVPATGDLLPE